MGEEIQYDVFLSHNEADEAAVALIGQRLRKEAGLAPFLDEWHIIPGRPWQEEIETALEQSETVAVFVGPSGISPWHNEEMRTALDEAVRSRDEVRVIPVLLPGASEEAVSRFLARRAWVDFRRGLDDGEAFQRLVAGIKGEAIVGGGYELPDEPSPYRGLLRFEAEHARFFFGRKADRQRLVEKLDQVAFVAVVGASGSGKSSLVRAGVLPALKDGALPGSREWQTLVFRPGSQPLRALAEQVACLVPIAERLDAADGLTRRLTEWADGLRTAVTTYLAEQPRPVLLVVDQLEELFTLCREAAEVCRGRAEQFIANLADVERHGDGRIRILVTLRADFLDRCLGLAGLRDLLQDRQVLLGSMDEPALREAIVRPAQEVGAFFEKGLVSTILRDVEAEPGALPLLEHALYELWRDRRGPWLTIDAYEASGGVRGALQRRAQATYDALTTVQQPIAQTIFLRLITLGEGVADTRRRVERSELYPVGVASDEVDAVLRALSGEKARLIVVDEECVEVAHEALIQRWDTLRGWLEENRVALRIHRRLTEDSEEWELKGHEPSYLYEGLRLEDTMEWAASRLDTLNSSERDFLFHSMVNENASLERWIPRYGGTTETIAFAEEYLRSGEAVERLKALAILRWLPSDEANRELNPLLLHIILTDRSQAVSNRAAEVLCERRQAAWLAKQLRSPDLSLDEKKQLTHVLGYARNRAGLGFDVEQTLEGRDRRQVLRSAAVQLIGEYRTQIAVVLSFSYVAAQVADEVISQISWTIQGLLDMDRTISVPYYPENLVVAMVFGLYLLIRADLDGKRITVVQCIWFGLLAGLVGESIQILMDIVEGIVKFATNAGQFPGMPQAFLALVETVTQSIMGALSTMIAMAVVVLAMRIFYSKKHQFRRMVLLSAVAPAVKILWDRVMNPLLFSLLHDRFIEQILRAMDASNLDVSQLHTWLVGAFITIACLLGFRLGLKVSFEGSFPSAPAMVKGEQHFDP